MRRYELMLVISPEAPDERSQAIIDRTTRQIVAGGGQIVKVAPWGRRRLAYPIGGQREGSYFIIVFESPADGIAELERGLLITEEIMRHLVTRKERPARATLVGGDEGEGADADDSDLPSSDDDEEDETERIDESETEAAPAAID